MQVDIFYIYLQYKQTKLILTTMKGFLKFMLYMILACIIFSVIGLVVVIDRPFEVVDSLAKYAYKVMLLFKPVVDFFLN